PDPGATHRDHYPAPNPRPGLARTGDANGNRLTPRRLTRAGGGHATRRDPHRRLGSGDMEARAMIYALWDFETNNLVAEYDEMHEALALVLRGIERIGPDDTHSLSLEAEDEQGEVHVIAHGRDLATLARQTLRREQLVPNETTIAAIQEAREGKLHSAADVDDLMARLNADD
ncbi:MAG: hypothetical protein H0V24_16695, partial [Chloroflexia bacterium]|nr:hypothetical protein [Chloroflexia bacterium]